jgi:maltokinase-like protein
MMVAMAIVHNTTMNPGKLELLAAWLPAQPWFPDGGREPELTKVGGFRLDDPQGEVGIEFMLVADGPAVYQVPMTYHGRELPGAEGRLIGTSEHGVLGRRWIYDGIRDPVLVAQLVAFFQGEVEAQAQSVSHMPDPTVTVQPAVGGPLAVISSVVTDDDPSGTHLLVDTASPDGLPAGELAIRIRRILAPDAGGPGDPCLSAPWRLPDGTQARGILATALHTPIPGLEIVNPRSVAPGVPKNVPGGTPSG